MRLVKEQNQEMSTYWIPTHFPIGIAIYFESCIKFVFQIQLFIQIKVYPNRPRFRSEIVWVAIVHVYLNHDKLWQHMVYSGASWFDVSIIFIKKHKILENVIERKSYFWKPIQWKSFT